MHNVKKGKIRLFIISQPLLRFIRVFFYNNILPYVKYSLYLSVLILVVVLIYLIVFETSKLQRIKNLVTKYSYKVINFSNTNIYSKINISGNYHTRYDEIADLARNYLINDGDINNIKMIKSLRNKIHSLPWVKEVVVSINLHDSLNIHVKEYKPFAIWENKNKRYIISKSGKIIFVKNIEQFGNLIILTGKNAHKNVKTLFNILSIDSDVSKNIYSASWMGNRRWNIRFENGLLIKLPSNNNSGDMKNAWDSLIKIYNMSGALDGLEVIDLRIANKIYLQYDDQKIKEIKSFESKSLS